MIVKFTVEHTIEPGNEVKALQLVKDINRKGNRYLPSLPRQAQRPQAINPKMATSEFYHHHWKCLSMLDPLSNTPARIRVHLTASA